VVKVVLNFYKWALGVPATATPLDYWRDAWLPFDISYTQVRKQIFKLN